MNLSHFFIDRPIFATVLSVFVIADRRGGLFHPAGRPVSRRSRRRRSSSPPVIPALPPKSSAIRSSTPLEQEINGVENMLYMSSQATADGNLQLTVTFALGTDLDISQVLVQNRVSIAEPKLPEEVRRLGVTVKKNSPDMLMVIHLSSPDGSRDQLYISNYATLQVKDVLARLDGVGDVRDIRRARLCDADLARSRQGRGAQPDRRRGRRRAPGAERPGRLGRARTSRRCREPGRLSAQRRDARAGSIEPRSSPTSSSGTTRTDGSPASATSAASSSAPQDYSANGYLDERRGRAAADLPAPGLECAGDRRSHQGDDAGAGAQLSERAAIRHRLQPDRVHRRIGPRGA